MSGMNTAVIFDRVSSEDQRDGFSLEAQRTLSEKYAKEHHLKVVRSWSVDESASKEDDRKHFFAMVEFIKTNKIQDVVFDKVDRACRGLKSAVTIEELIEHNGVKFHFTREHLIIDKNSPPQEKLRFYLGTILGKYYIDNLKTEINKGLDARRQAGLWNGLAPFGYKNIRTGPQNKATVVKDEDEAPVVKEVFQLYSTGNYTYASLVDFIESKLPNKKITKRLIETILENPFYYGVMKVKSEILKGSHEPLIDKRLFDTCQKIRGIRAASYRSNRKGAVVKPFMGFLTCGCCNHAITGESVLKASGKTYIYYRCANNKCLQYRLRAPQEELFKQLSAAFTPFRKWTPKAVAAFIENMHSRLQDLDLYTQKRSGEIAGKKLELKKRVEQLDVYRQQGILSQSEYDAAVAVPMKLLAEQATEMQAYESADLKTFQEGCRIIQLFRKAYDFMQMDGNELEKIQLARAVLSNPTLANRTMQFSYKKPLDDLLALTDRPIWWRPLNAVRTTHAPKLHT